MMLHRHFEEERKKAVSQKHDEGEFVSEIFPPDVDEEQPKKRGRTKKD